jgi:protease-4
MNRMIALIAGSLVCMSAAAADLKMQWLEITGTPTEKPNPLAWLMGNEKDPTLRQLVDAIEAVGEDADAKGLIIRLKDAQLSTAQVTELGEAISHARKAGKKVHVFGESFDTSDFLLGSYADHVACQSGGAVSLSGIYMEEMFLADTLSWAGVKANYVQVGDYKGASEQMARNGPSKEWDQNINQLLDSMYANVRRSLIAGRKLDDARLDKAMEQLWMADASEAVKAGLIDAEIDLPQYIDSLSKQYGEKVTIEKVEAGAPGKFNPETANPLTMMATLGQEPKHEPKGPAIAVLHIDGAIVDGESTGGFSGDGEVGSRTIRNALEDILHESKIKGVVVRIDSPGGSATASEIIWQGIRRVADVKPVWVSIGGMAASGGYYIAVAGERIYVTESSIVGSIGVVGGKLSMQGLYDKFQVKVVSRGRGPRSTMFSSAAAWTEDEAKHVRTKMTETYDLFTKRVTSGRKGIELAKTAEGRLFTGDLAIGLKMADQIGGLDDAISDLATSLSMSDVEVIDYPAPKALPEVIEDMLGSAGGGLLGQAPGAFGSLPTPLASTVREVVGEQTFEQLRAPLSALMQMRDGKVLLVSPRVLIFK